MVSVVRRNGRHLNVMGLMCLKGVEVSEIRPYWNLVVVMTLVTAWCEIVVVGMVPGKMRGYLLGTRHTAV